MHKLFPGLLVIEDNAAGEAVRENLNLRAHEVNGFNMTKPSKARILQQLKIALQNETLKWDPDACPQLDAEMRGYQLPDDNFVQDSVMTLAIALEHADKAHLATGRVLGVYLV